MKNAIIRVNAGLSLALLVVAVGAWLLFGWSGSGWKALAIPTGSMRPSIPPGSLVFVHRVPVSNLKAGDVITYNNPLHPNTTISHRIVKTYQISGSVPGFVTKGDANTAPDIPVAAGAVLGKVAWHVPNAGWWLLDAKKPAVILPVVYLAALLIMLEEIIRLRDYFKLALPWRAPGYAGREQSSPKRPGLSLATGLGAVLVLTSVLLVGQSAAALLKSNPASLTHNRISVKVKPKCKHYDKHKKHCDQDDHHHHHIADTILQVTEKSSTSTTINGMTTQTTKTKSVTISGDSKKAETSMEVKTATQQASNPAINADTTNVTTNAGNQISQTSEAQTPGAKPQLNKP